jgi:hypothetical protein
LSTLALGTEAAPAAGTEAAPAADGARAGVLVRYADLLLLALTLPVFILADWPLVGYAAVAVAWLAQHVILAYGDRASTAALRRGDRRRALGIVGATLVGRLWLVTLAILLVGLLGEREDGLAAAIMALVLVTVHLACLALSKLFYPEGAA